MLEGKMRKVFLPTDRPRKAVLFNEVCKSVYPGPVYKKKTGMGELNMVITCRPVYKERRCVTILISKEERFNVIIRFTIEPYRLKLIHQSFNDKPIITLT